MVLKADDAHLLVQLVGSIIIIYREGQMELVIAQIVGTIPIPQPSQFQTMGTAATVTEIDDDETAVFRGDTASL